MFNIIKYAALIALCSAAFMFTAVYAAPYASGVSAEKYPLFWSLGRGDFELWTDGLRFSAVRPGDMLEVTLNSLELEDKDYATAYLYKNEMVNLTEYGEVYFYFNNQSDEPLKMNFMITFASGEEYNVTENMPILTLPVEAAVKEIIPSEWGAVEIPPGFVGDIHIPGYKVKNMAGVLEEFISFGISFTIPKGVVHKFLISDVRLVPLELSSPLYGFEIVGSGDIQMPVVGEAVSRYSVSFTDVYFTGGAQGDSFEVKFGLLEELEGVSIADDGTLTVRGNLETRHFIIYADINGELRGYMPIEVYDHWSMGLGHDELKTHLPREDEVVSLKTNNPLFNPNALYIIRFVFMAAAAVMCGVYAYYSAPDIKP